MLSANPTTYSRHSTRASTPAGPELSYVDVPSSLYTRYGKRLFDLTVAAFVTVFVLSWMIPLIGLAICLTSRGPILFVQVRSGRNGRVFHCLKFRTMYHAPTAAFAQARKGDARITRIGAFLRRTNLDEMPQFWNVLMGDMSIVGPRPHAVQHDDLYWHTIQNYRSRYEVRPGITGLAQVRGARGETRELVNMKHRVQYDLLYVKKQSIGLDAKLCLGTVQAMLKGNVNAW
ncbi:putative colanic acid biosysnthesis UDP-glucose lipid carrier transferase [Fibrella aestuarina BUZ 2]|uniref:Putative colanic acid biosysnthesis UDP-glucose lipid carrier transferase n=1 Tax=Fibrella aestuarina BUZ 2 TaxID=1166018 RepID=I0K3V7_9BACT|nr:sugar transferase [Fibrella aestuarina]CCG98810.1 putative colanic acid biosysnthesis UDP-glucose lipid carrier transferase [Fibrella aestuarina BUZ 2]